jgi:hypothetical protein
MNRRVLIVTSSYAPAMIADMHRARQLAWELPSQGWNVEILTPDASYQQPSCLDGESGAFFAPGTPVHSVPMHLPRLFKALGFGSIGWRALRPMRRMGDLLLGSGRFDIVYFSTTQFPLFLLGPRWQRRHGVPFVLDFHDPCYREVAAPPLWARRSLKHATSRRLTRLIESKSVLGASGLIAVSPVYIDTLRRRYAERRPMWLSPGKSATLPFAVLPRDLDEATRSSGVHVRPADDSLRLVYVGAGGPIMKRSFDLFCRTLARVRLDDALAIDGLRVELYGTMMGWRDGERKHLAEVAEVHGVADLVHEDPRRVSYRRSIELLLGSDGALILGVEDAGYMPSKLFSYAYSGKPLVAMVHRNGPAMAAMKAPESFGSTLWFDEDEEIPLEEGAEILRLFLQAAARRAVTDRRRSLEPHLATAIARRHGELFSACCEGISKT